MRKVRNVRALTSLSAMAVALAAGPAFAQSVPLSYNAGDPTIVSGSVTFDRGVTSGSETYTINSSTAVIDFTPSDTATGGGAITFQNAGTNVLYVNGSGTTNYTVLNRIVPVDPSRPVQFNGTVTSRVQGGAAVGGNLWFYSPGGIILGGQAAFDVGGLLLSAADPTGGTGIIGSTTSFSGGGTAGSYVTISTGATVDATADGSYVALMAPGIRQSGSVRVNGSAAYVAAESATLTINSGLFDIVVGTGTDTEMVTGAGGESVALYHNGETTGPSSTGGSDPQNIVMVMVPKNDAITMLVQSGGQLGFDLAGGATVVDGAVVLSAGYNVTGGQIDSGAAVGGPGDASLIIQSGDYTSDVVGRAKTEATAGATGSTPRFRGDLTLAAGGRALLGSGQAGATLRVDGDLTLIGETTFTGGASPSVRGGVASMFTNGGSIAIGGNVILTTDATAPSATGGSSAQGGQALIRAIGGSIDIGGSVTLSSNAIGGAAGPGGTGATLTGGLAEMVAEANGTIDVGGRLQSNADAIGSVAQAGVAGTATGGQAYARTEASGGTIILRGDADFSAIAQGNAGGSASATGGAATGGIAYVRAQSGSITIEGATTLDASGSGGDAFGGSDGGNGTGGRAFIQADANTDIVLNDMVGLLANGSGGDNGGGGDGIAAIGTGGLADIVAIGDIAISGNVALNVSALGGDVFAGTSGTGGAAQGGRARVLGQGGAFTIDGNVLIDATGTGGFVSTAATGDGGAGRGGGARVGTVAAGSSLTVTGDVDLEANGFGSDGVGAGSVGGAGMGGNLRSGASFLEGVYLVADAGDLAVEGAVRMSATGLGGDGATGGEGRGGWAYALGNDGALAVTGILSADVDGFGGDGLIDIGGTGGLGVGGAFTMGTFAANGVNGSVQLQDVLVTAAGLGGLGGESLTGVGGRGGNGMGGVIQATADASSGAVVAGDLTFVATGSGGDGSAGGNGEDGINGFAGGAGGDGTGGTISLGTLSGANLPSNTGSATFGAATLYSFGAGGSGGSGGGGGDGLAGGPGLSGGDGGDGAIGGAGGIGRGGSILTYARGTPLMVESIQGLAMGIGGQAGTGGAAGAGGAAGSGGSAGTDGAAGVDGDGGAGVGGGAGLYVTNRAGRTERGTATIGDVNFITFGFGGIGNVIGAATGGQGELIVSSGDATIASYSLANNSGGSPLVGAPGMSIEVADGTLDVTNALTIATLGDMALNVRDGGVLRTGALALSGSGSLLAVAPGGISGTPGLLDIGGDFSASFADGTTGAASLEIGANLSVAGDAFLFGDQIRLADVTADGVVDITGQAVQSGVVRGGGNVSIVANGGDIATNDIVSEGGSLFVQASAGGVVTGDVASVETLAITARDDVTTGDLISSDGAVTLQSDAAIGTGNLSAGMTVSIGALESLSTGDIRASTLASAAALGQGGVSLNAAQGRIETGDISAAEILLVQGGGGVADRIETGNLSAESIIVNGGGAVTLGDVTASDLFADFDPFAGRTVLISGDAAVVTGDLSSHAGLVTLLAANGAITSGTVRAADISVRQGDGGAAGAIVMGDLTAERMTVVGRGDVMLGDVSASDLYADFDPADGLQTVVNGGGAMTLGDVTGQDTIILATRGGPISAGLIRTPGSAVVLTPRDVTLAGVTTGTGADDIFYASDVQFSGYDDSFRDAAGGVFDTAALFSAGLGATDGSTFRSGTVSTGTLRAAAQFMEFGAIDATSRVDLFGTRSVAFSGVVTSPDISVDTGDITIGDAARLGDADTQLINLRAVIFDTPVVIGGDAGAGGYHLSAAEAGRLRAHNILFEAVRSGGATATSDMLVRNLTLSGSGAGDQANLFGAGALLTLRAEGVIRVEGALGLGNMADTDRLSIESLQRIEVATGQGGSLALTGANASSLGGVLAFDAPVIVSGSNALLEQMAADPNFAGRDTLLALPGDVARPEGFIQARTLDFSVSNVLAIQNSGSTSLAGGFTAGLGGMVIRARANPAAIPAQVSIWGRVQTGDTTYLTNFDTIGGVTFETLDSPPFSLALVNGCRLGAICGDDRPDGDPGPDTPGEIVTTVAAIEKLLTSDVAQTIEMPEIRFVQVVDQQGLVSEQIITEPVAGAGNSGIWQDMPVGQGEQP